MKKKVLHSSFACDPNMGSEPYVGWNWAKMLSENFDLHVITRRHHYKTIQSTTLAKKVKFHYFDLPGLSNLDHRHKLMKLYYVFWQLILPLKVLIIHARYRFDLIHHITYNNIDLPGFLWLIPFTKFVWGPVGGGQTPPISLKSVYGKFWKKELLRKKLKQFVPFNPIIRKAILNTDLVLFANQDTEKLLSNFNIKKLRILETAIDINNYAITLKKRTGKNVKLLWVGRIEHRKALCLALDCVKKGYEKYGNEFSVSLDILGSGPLLQQMKSYATSLQIDNVITFHGNINFDIVKEFFAKSDIFLFTSVQDTSGNVILEAMSFGMPVIALNHQGAKEILSDGGGVLIKIDDYDATSVSFADAIFFLTKNRADYERLSSEALKSISSNFTWNAKRKKVISLYNEIFNTPKDSQ